jgi:hypothetical protein
MPRSAEPAIRSTAATGRTHDWTSDSPRLPDRRYLRRRFDQRPTLVGNEMMNCVILHRLRLVVELRQQPARQKPKILRVFIKIQVFKACFCTGAAIKFKLVYSLTLGLWPASSAQAGHFFRGRGQSGVPRTLGRLATLLSARDVTGGMPRTLGHIARLDRRWFRAHPERRHRCRWPDTVELDLCDSDGGARLVAGFV